VGAEAGNRNILSADTVKVIHWLTQGEGCGRLEKNLESRKNIPDQGEWSGEWIGWKMGRAKKGGKGGN